MLINDKNFEPYISASVIKAAVLRIANEISNDYKDQELVCIVILKGSFIFAADLIRHIQNQCRIEFITARSYGTSMNSSGNVELQLPDFDIQGKHVLIIEDIIDTGYTLSALLSSFREFSPVSIECVTLFSKPEMRKVQLDIRYKGIEIPPVFIVGYGLDYAEYGRNLPDIWALSSYLNEELSAH